MILAVDTSTELTSIAVTEGDTVLVERRHRDPRRHAEVTAPLLAEVLGVVGPGGIRAVACGVGPGPYTGLRVGIATARALGLAWSVPVLGLCSLDAMAAAWRSTHGDQSVGVASDARRREVYWAVYGADGRRVRGPQVNAPTDLVGDHAAGPAQAAGPGEDVLDWIGHGAAVHASTLRGVRITVEDDSPLAFPDAGWIGRCVGALLDSGTEATQPTIELARHGDDGGPTARALRGATLLPPRPLYLRRADTTEPRPA